jgi:hypothetical protein
VFKIDAAGILTVFAGSGLQGFAGDGGVAVTAQLSMPRGVAVDASGNVVIADTNNHRIRRVDAATGIITTAAGNGLSGYAGDGGAATAARLSSPVGLDVDAANTLIRLRLSRNQRRFQETSTAIGISQVKVWATPSSSDLLMNRRPTVQTGQQFVEEQFENRRLMPPTITASESGDQLWSMLGRIMSRPLFRTVPNRGDVVSCRAIRVGEFRFGI